MSIFLFLFFSQSKLFVIMFLVIIYIIYRYLSSMGTKQLPSITIIQNKLLDDKVNINAAQVKDAEKEYQEICKTTGRVPEVRAIEEMIESLERGQIKCAKAHAGRVQEAIIFYQKNLQKNAGDQYMNANIMENIAKVLFSYPIPIRYWRLIIVIRWSPCVRPSVVRLSILSFPDDNQ